MPITEIIAGAALGLVLQVLQEAIKNSKDKSSTTKCILGRLEGTISSITPLVAQVDKLSEELEDSQKKVVKDLKGLLEKAVRLVKDYAELRRRNLLKKFRYKRRIKELEASLRWMLDVNVQVNQLLNIHEIMAKMTEMNIKLEEITRQPTDCSCFKSNQSLSSQTSNHCIVEETARSLEENVECSSDGAKPKIDITCRPIDCIRSDEYNNNNNQNIVQRVDPSLEANDGCSNDDSNPKIDIHLRWRKQSKNHGMRFVFH